MWTIFFVQLAGLISPGPDFLYVCRKAMADTRRNAFFGIVGIVIGVGFWSLLVMFGLSFLNRTIPVFQQILMCLGGSYLAYSGLKMVRIKQSTVLDNRALQTKRTSAWQEIRQGLLINLSNPKIIVFFSSVLAGYVGNLSNGADAAIVFLILTGSAFVYFCLLAQLLSHPDIRRFYAKNNRYLDNLAGVIFIFFGLVLIYEGVTDIVHLI